MVVSIWAVIKCGATYVPIAPDTPAARIRHVVQDAGCKWLISHAPVPGDLDRWLDVSRVKTLAASAPSGNPPDGSGADTPLYIIYTSGSTGEPKGTLIRQRHLLSLLFHEAFPFDFTDQDVWSLLHSFSFDFSVWELFCPLLKGARVVVASEEERKDPRAMAELVVSNGVTVLNVVPTVFYNLYPHLLSAGQNGRLHTVMLAGEALNPALLREWYAHNPSCRLYNAYGLTEATIHVTCHRVTAEDVRSGISNIGSALPNAKLYVVDRRRNLSPWYVPGELAVAGAGLAEGYLHRPALSAQKFVPNLLDPSVPSGLYLTGDRGYLLPNGEVVFTGRADHYLKVNGFRIEAFEVEKAMLDFKGISAVAVGIYEDASGHGSLAAWLVRTGPVRKPELLEHLRAVLPNYMIPSLFIEMERLPYTTNGKLDRKSLAAPEPYRLLKDHVDYVPPQNDVQAVLCGCWQQVLGVDPVGIDNDFFELGGDSIKAMRVISFLFKQGYEVEIRDIMRATTIRQLSGCVRLQPGEVAAPEAPVAQAISDEDLDRLLSEF
jgi:amino acid adenylation domain-containing protein